MVLDTSAVVAILLNEAEAEALIRAVALDSVRLISAVSLFESSMVIEGKKRVAGIEDLD